MKMNILAAICMAPEGAYVIKEHEIKNEWNGIQVKKLSLFWSLLGIALEQYKKQKTKYHACRDNEQSREIDVYGDVGVYIISGAHSSVKGPIIRIQKGAIRYIEPNIRKTVDTPVLTRWSPRIMYMIK